VTETAAEPEPEKFAVSEEDLPEEEKWQVRKRLPDSNLVNGPIPQEDLLPPKEFDESDPSGVASYLRNEGLKNYRFFAQYDNYNIEMKDGTFQKYTRRSISDDEFEEIEDLRAEVEGGMELDSGKALNRVEIRQREKRMEAKKAEYYLINSKTKKPMSPTEKRNVRHAYVINGILNACILRTKSDAVEGKK